MNWLQKASSLLYWEDIINWVRPFIKWDKYRWYHWTIVTLQSELVEVVIGNPQELTNDIEYDT